MVGTGLGSTAGESAGDRFLRSVMRELRELLSDSSDLSDRSDAARCMARCEITGIDGPVLSRHDSGSRAIVRKVRKVRIVR